ncbi:MAG TPA: hypothetical protein VLV82_06755 [Candidatus Angelobacter sp.]|nr:hypothetical protein [Candidatus Angelobacter sp.]
MTALRLLPEFEAALRAVPGIREASVRTGPDAHPIEVHVVAGGLKPAKQVLRDVQSIAMAQFDLDIDHRIVSVVQIPDDAVEAGDTGEVSEAGIGDEALPRPALMRIATTRSDTETTVDVHLGIGGSVFSGRADGPSGHLNRPRITASATLAALSELLGIPSQVESALVAEVGTRKVALTTVILTIPRLGDQVLCGSALVRDNEEDAVARSVLAAVNRRLAG